MKPRVKGAIAAVLILIGINILAKVYVESLWFQELNLLPVYWKRLGWQLGIAVLFGGFSWGFLSYQIRVARGLAEAATPQPSPPISDIRSRYLPDPLNASRRSPRSGALYLPVLLPLIVALQFTIAALGDVLPLGHSGGMDTGLHPAQHYPRDSQALSYQLVIY